MASSWAFSHSFRQLIITGGQIESYTCTTKCPTGRTMHRKDGQTQQGAGQSRRHVRPRLDGSWWGSSSFPTRRTTCWMFGCACIRLDLAPGGSHLFRAIKISPRACHFTAIDELEPAVQVWEWHTIKNRSQRCMKRLSQWW